MPNWLYITFIPACFKAFPKGDEKIISKLKPNTKYGRHKGSSIIILIYLFSLLFSLVKLYDVGIDKNIQMIVDMVVVIKLSFSENCISFETKASFIYGIPFITMVSTIEDINTTTNTVIIYEIILNKSFPLFFM